MKKAKNPMTRKQQLRALNKIMADILRPARENLLASIDTESWSWMELRALLLFQLSYEAAIRFHDTRAVTPGGMYDSALAKVKAWEKTHSVVTFVPKPKKPPIDPLVRMANAAKRRAAKEKLHGNS